MRSDTELSIFSFDLKKRIGLVTQSGSAKYDRKINLI